MEVRKIILIRIIILLSLQINLLTLNERSEVKCDMILSVDNTQDTCKNNSF